MSINLLYVSCHGTLEYNELKIFNSLGFNVRSIGVYTDPYNPIDQIFNPPLVDLPQDLDFIEKAKNLYSKWPSIPLKGDLIKDFDVIIVAHALEPVQNNFALIKDKIVIRRTVGQGCGAFEHSFLKYAPYIKTVRVSKKERAWRPYAGEDAIILGPVDPYIYDGSWVGTLEKSLTIKNRFNKYPHASRYDVWLDIVKETNYTLVGKENESILGAVSNLSYKELLDYYRAHRVCICMPSRPAPITYGLAEALMMGSPVVTLGPVLGGERTANTYEHHEIIQNGITGFYSDNVFELRNYIKDLLSDFNLAKKISNSAKEQAKTLFHPDVIKNKWKDFFKTLGINL